VPRTSIHILEQTETPFIHILEQTETTQSESSHSEPTNDYHRRAAFLKHKTNNMESPSQKKARTDVQPDEGMLTYVGYVVYEVLMLI
jgi:hypothetical protein